ncbi:hypothetical protein QR680_000359 [Steinernema hermaphroditum]|uniref:Uncharacterized protein n=1 Tax=Steinernema hermaphroditum TaxID=289476 RepID=A0AA39GWB2_9BILA|nr:hypothetical protein QR680_000359 [Steinernema hermaphroditum]
MQIKEEPNEDVPEPVREADMRGVFVVFSGKEETPEDGEPQELPVADGRVAALPGRTTEPPVAFSMVRKTPTSQRRKRSQKGQKATGHQKKMNGHVKASTKPSHSNPPTSRKQRAPRTNRQPKVAADEEPVAMRTRSRTTMKLRNGRRI